MTHRGWYAVKQNSISIFMLLSPKLRNIKLSFNMDRLNLLNMRRKIIQREKDEIIHTVWKIEKKKKRTIFTVLIVISHGLSSL